MIVNSQTGLPFVPGEPVVTIVGNAATYVGCNARDVFIQIGPRISMRPPSDIGAVIKRERE